jgi:hypothetical protein
MGFQERRHSWGLNSFNRTSHYAKFDDASRFTENEFKDFRGRRQPNNADSPPVNIFLQSIKCSAYVTNIFFLSVMEFVAVTFLGVLMTQRVAP